MSYVSLLGDFFISEWIWSFTFGLYHIPINIVIMFLLIKCFMHSNAISTVMMVFFANVFSFLVLAGAVIGIFVYGFGIVYMSTETSHVFTPLGISLSLGLSYSFLQTLFFWLLHFRYSLSVLQLSIIALFANGLSSLLVYALLPSY